MEGNGGGGSAAAGQSVAGGAAPMAASGNWSQGNNGAGAPGGANGTSMDHYNGVHLQQLMIAQQGSTPNQLQMPTAAAAAAAGMTHNPQQTPTLNMIMAAAMAAGQGLHPMQSPPTSQGQPPMGPGGPGFLILPQTAGMPNNLRDISPNSTPGVQQQPAPAATPPNLMGLDLEQRPPPQWTVPPNPPNIVLGTRMMGDKLDHDVKPEMFQDGFHHQRQELFNHQLQDLARMNPGFYIPAQSPPAPNMFQQTMPMPPRPRPEGGQDPSPTFLDQDNNNVLNGSSKKQEDLIIGPWNEEEVDKSLHLQQQPQFQPHMMAQPQFGNNNLIMQQQRSDVEGMKEHPPAVSSSGWGDIPAPNPSGSWGSTSATGGPPNVPPPPINAPPKMGNWSGPPNYSAPPPTTGPHFDSNRGRGGGRGGFGGGRGSGRMDHFVDNRGGYRGGGRGRGRGRGGYGGPPVDHSQEKMDGKKSAIADTIAMMNKMKLEDKERKEARQKYERERKQEIGLEEQQQQDDSGHVNDGLHDEPLHRRNQREREQRRGGPPRGRGGTTNPPRMPQGAGPLFGPGQSMFLPPPGLLHPHGLDFTGFAPPPAGAGFPGQYGAPNFYPIPGQGFPPSHFRGGFVPRGGRGGVGGFPPFRGGFNPAMAGRGMPGLMPRGRGRGRGGGGGHHHQPPVVKSPEEPELPKTNGGDADSNADQVENNDSKAIEVSEDLASSKNLNSEQGTTSTKGQLALFATEKVEEVPDNLRDRLTQQLVAGKAECMVCLDKIKLAHATWDCQHCYQVFHIHCVKKWAKTQLQDEGWRCPGCQTLTASIPKNYKCFCRKVVDPPVDRRETPHSCGDVCGKDRACAHPCTDLCHPGPCPPCAASVRRSCPCGKTQQSVRCTAEQPLCDAVCDKVLDCGVHRCHQTCHREACRPCAEKLVLVCHCRRAKQETVDCASHPGKTRFSCGEICGERLSCDNHDCQDVCHEGPCQPCSQSPEQIKTCFCGKSAVERQSCLEPVPSCGKVCGRKLTCGPVGNNHTCQEVCHAGPCPSCPLQTEVKCRCGSMDKEIECKRLESRADDARCDKRCSKKRNCGRHKCGQLCCIDIDHVCTLTCGKLLSCGTHRCQDQCHRGNCGTCPNVSFDELRCHCGAQVLYPPIHCGTKPPTCQKSCTRSHTCGHPVRHSCHNDQQCPPCTELTSKQCFGNHEVRKNVVCHLEGISCGRPCGKQLPCYRHACIRSCHEGPCQSTGAQCSQSCAKPRPSCGHSCAAPCHEGDCPKTSCNERIKVQCVCGNLKKVVICCESDREYQRIRTSQLAAQLFQGGGGSSVAINDFSGSGKNTKLDCNEECSQIERNRRMALALQIENPDISNKVGPPKYSDTLKDYAKKDPVFAKNIHDLLTTLVMKTKESTFKYRSHQFDCMGREKRQFVHELASHFGCSTQSFDAEPKRNVVATAAKDEVWLPTISVVEVAQGMRKAPVPKL